MQMCQIAWNTNCIINCDNEVDVSITHPLFPAVSGDGLHGALEFESKFADRPGTLFGLDPGLGRL